MTMLQVSPCRGTRCLFRQRYCGGGGGGGGGRDMLHFHDSPLSRKRVSSTTTTRLFLSSAATTKDRFVVLLPWWRKRRNNNNNNKHTTHCTSYHTSSIVRHQDSTTHSSTTTTNSSSSSSIWDDFDATHGPQLNILPEVMAMKRLEAFLQAQVQAAQAVQSQHSSPHRIIHPSSSSSSSSSSPYNASYTHEMTRNQWRTCLDSAMMTFLVHVYARQASLVGQGFYTIGPCGEELLASAALALQEQDSLALHYRHLAISMTRQLQIMSTPVLTNEDNRRNSIPSEEDEDDDDDYYFYSNQRVKDILLARARGYTVSVNDPVTGGVHCAISGGGPNDYVVTSTLASQCPPAVGRALAYGLKSYHQQQQQEPATTPTTIADTTDSKKQKTKSRPISMCTIGDGSVHNGHFWSAWTLARHAKHLGIKCPMVMGISDNGLSISYETKGFVNRLFGGDGVGGVGVGTSTHKPSSLLHTTRERQAEHVSCWIDNGLIPVFRANGQDMMDVYDQSLLATTHARTYGSPVLLLYSNLVRRFGHAATDRQAAYLDPTTIATMTDTDVVQHAMIQAVEQQNVMSYAELLDRYQELQQWTKEAFATTMQEPKVTLEGMMERVVPPLVEIPKVVIVGTTTKVAAKVTVAAAPPPPPAVVVDGSAGNTPSSITTSTSRTTMDDSFVTTIFTYASSSSSSAPNKITAKEDTASSSSDEVVVAIEKPQVMRKHMTRVLEEIMKDDPSVVYLGEDVKHGGYYLVTEGLAQQFPGRVIDFPPDETSLLGAALGFRQVGNVLPIVELPYAKYLDCGADMFYEIALMHWLSNNDSKKNNNNKEKKHAHKKTTGMVVRLQGFDRGVFGGNFHTHNMLSHIPPGVDVVCFSNGSDYVQGMRHAVLQAKEAGRIVVTVDCTHLLNLRHLLETGDRGWEQPYPSLVQTGGGEEDNRYLGFDTVRRYRYSEDNATTKSSRTCASVVIVSYGNGVVAALEARRSLVESGVFSTEAELDVVDCPYISGVPKGLEQVLQEYKSVVFADICKEGPGSNVFSSMVMSLQEKGFLPPKWTFVGAPRTYNPLGSTVTFLNQERIQEAVQRLI